MERFSDDGSVPIGLDRVPPLGGVLEIRWDHIRKLGRRFKNRDSAVGMPLVVARPVVPAEPCAQRDLARSIQELATLVLWTELRE